jgi:hypothetical protein
VQIFLWPNPDSAGTIRFQRRRLLADTDLGSATIDLERHWIKYIEWELAHHLAVAAGLDVQRCGYMRSQAEKALKLAKGYSRQRTHTQMHLDHRTRWGRGR